MVYQHWCWWQLMLHMPGDKSWISDNYFSFCDLLVLTTSWCNYRDLVTVLSYIKDTYIWDYFILSLLIKDNRFQLSRMIITWQKLSSNKVLKSICISVGLILWMSLHNLAFYNREGRKALWWMIDSSVYPDLFFFFQIHGKYELSCARQRCVCSFLLVLTPVIVQSTEFFR